MVDIENLTLYYYDTGESAWTQVTSIIQFPVISKRMDTYSTCIVTLHDFEGSLYSTWSSRDNTQMKIEDADSNILFQGYLKDKDLQGKALILTIWGFASRLDESPFNQDFVLATGLVKTVPGAGHLPYDISDTGQPNCIYYDKVLNIYLIPSFTDFTIYVYDEFFEYLDEYDISGDDIKPMGITRVQNYYYMVGYEGPGYAVGKLYTCALDFSSISELNDLSECDLPCGIDYNEVDSHFHILSRNDEKIHTYVATIGYYVNGVSVAETDTPKGIHYSDGLAYVVSEADDKVYIYDVSGVTPSGDLEGSYSLSSQPSGITFKKDLFYVTNLADKKVYLFNEGFTAIDDDYTVDLKQDDEDAGYPDFTWSSHYWAYTRNVGLSIKDTTTGDSSKTYTVSAFTPSNEDAEYGNAASAATPYDDDMYAVDDTDGTIDVSVSVTVDGDNIADTNSLRSITINYRIGNYIANASYAFPVSTTVYLQVKKDLGGGSFSWVTAGQVYNWWGAWTANAKRVEGSFLIEGSDTELQAYMHKTGANYDALYGVRLTMTGSKYLNSIARIECDYLNAIITYQGNTISPLVTKITDNGASWVSCQDADFTVNGVQENDTFYIGASTTEIISSIQSNSFTDIKILSTLTKYMARKFKGSNCTQGLQDVCKLEGCHWAEDHANGVIVVAKEADFEDSGLSLTTGNGDADFSYKDHVNHYKGVIVHGNASLNIEGRAEDLASTSFKWYQLADDTLMTNSDAQSVAESELAELQDKRPSLVFSKTDTDGSHAAAEAMKTIDVTVTRPTIAEATYPTRRMDIAPQGEHLKYTFYMGLGSTPADEQDANFKREIALMLQKQNVFRLANTPLGAGASITPNDIAGLDTYTTNLIDTNSTQHSRFISPIAMEGEQGLTSGANNVYKASGYIYFGTDSKSNNNYCTCRFFLPDDYVANSDVVFHVFYRSPTGADTTDYKVIMYRLRHSETTTSEDTEDSTWTTEGANEYIHKEVTLSQTNGIQANDMLDIYLYMEDDDNAQTLLLEGVMLEITVNGRD